MAGLNEIKVQIRLLTTLYGASDEIHQIFEQGRTPLLGDVMIDSLGAAAVLLIR